MKKTLSLILALSLILVTFCVPTAYADVGFNDLSSEHWAYQNIMELVSQGSINGYNDGTFLPDGTVTRCEFVKMLGKTSTARQNDFDDVPKDYWGYDYIMYSGINGDKNNKFRPDEAIKRYEVADILYTRFGNNAKTIAPLCITGTDNKEAVAWVYNTNLMIGDDKINLRLSDTLTRAEAATLIVRAQNIDTTANKDFVAEFSDDTYKKVYEGSGLFDSEYSADENISNGEIALAALRFQFRVPQPPLGNYYYSSLFEDKYSREWNIMTSYVFDNVKFKCTKEECNENAKVSDTLAMFAYCLKNNPYAEADVDTSNHMIYPELKPEELSQTEYASLSFAYNYGISLYANGVIKPDKEITKKELACIIMQFDAIYGANLAFCCGYESFYIPTPVRRDVSSYPNNAIGATSILEDVPNEVYTTPFNESGLKNCSDFTKSSKDLASHLATQIMSVSFNAYQKGIDVYLTYYPTLVCEYAKGYIFRVNVNVEGVPEGAKLSDILPLNDGISDFDIASGMSFYADISTNSFFKGLTLDANLMTISNIIK